MPKIENRKSKFIFLVLRIAVVAAAITWAIIWLSREQRWESLKSNFAKINPGIFVLTLIIFTFSHIIVSFRWWLLLRTQSIFISFWAAVRLYFLGWFYNNFMPSSVGGDLIRAWYVTRHTEKKFKAVLSVFVDRAIGLASTLVITVFFYTVFVAGKGNKIEFERKKGLLSTVTEYRTVIFWFFLGICIVFCVLLLHKRGRAILYKLWLLFYKKTQEFFKKLMQAVVIYFSRPLVILGAFILTVGMQLMAITSFWILGKNMGIDLSVKYYYVSFTLMWVIGALPISIGGAGVMEVGLVYLFTQLSGIDPESALAIALCQRFIWMITSLPGAVIHLIGAHLPKDFFIDYNEPLA